MWDWCFFFISEISYIFSLCDVFFAFSLRHLESQIDMYVKGHHVYKDIYMSSVKWSNPVHFLKSQGKFFLSFPCTLFYIFLTPKITDEILKSTLGRSILHY